MLRDWLAERRLLMLDTNDLRYKDVWHATGHFVFLPKMTIKEAETSVFNCQLWLWENRYRKSHRGDFYVADLDARVVSALYPAGIVFWFDDDKAAVHFKLRFA